MPTTTTTITHPDGTTISVCTTSAAIAPNSASGAGAEWVGTKNREEALSVWRDAKTVCFDVDSTVCEDEAIDRLAAFLGVGEDVAAWTAKAMGGNVTFQESLGARLGIMKASLKQLNDCLAAEAPRLTAGIAELVKLLHSRGVKVYLVTGGFFRMVQPIAALLNIPDENIFSNKLLFDADGNYNGFDDTCYTSKSGGKTEAVKHLKTLPGHEVAVMIGDGATDMEARPPADLFIGFGGNVVREKVLTGADWFAYSFDELIAPLRA